MKPIVALVGRPNVGKSTLFNRITRSTNAIVDDFPGVTRDRNYGDAEWEGVEFTLVDTGGFLGMETDAFGDQIHFQVRQAMNDADAIILLLDGKHGTSPFDAELIGILRTERKPVFYAVNKIDTEAKENNLYEFYGLGIEKLYPVSAAHNYGVGDFLDDLVDALPRSEPEAAGDTIRIAVVGRPNVGKSSLINRILGKDRLLVSDVPGTTRDAIDTPFTFGGRSYLLIDTAGIRRKGKVSEKLEKFSVVRALRSLDRCDVALIVMDAHEGITDQDVTVAGYALERGCGAILLLNKWDLVEKDNRTEKRYMEKLRDATKYMNFAPAMTLSALTGQRVSRLFKLVDEIYAQYCARIGTGQLNRILQEAVTRTEPSLYRGRRINFYYATQVTSRPPTFVFFVNYPDAVHFSYRRYLVNQIRESTGLDRTPIRTYFRKRTGREKGGK